MMETLYQFAALAVPVILVGCLLTLCVGFTITVCFFLYKVAKDF